MEEIHLCLSDLLDADLSSYELFHSLSPQLQEEVVEQDLRSFEELTAFLAEKRGDV